MESVYSFTVVETIIADFEKLASQISALQTASLHPEIELDGLLELLQSSRTLWSVCGHQICSTVTLRVSSRVHNWWILDLQNSINQLGLWCEALRAQRRLSVHYAENLQSGILPKAIFEGEQPRRPTLVVLEQLKILRELDAVVDKYCLSSYSSIHLLT
jgi:hypothetical protein